jgi:hypothetical protein
MKPVCFVVAWVLYWLGDIASRPLEWRDTERWVGFWYSIYNTLMVASGDVQAHVRGNGPKWPWGPGWHEGAEEIA